jgi:hypothetical protein
MRNLKSQENAMNKTKFITFIICAVVATSAQAQNLLLNGSFESPIIAANSYNPTATPTSWQPYSDDVAMVNGVSSYGGLWPLPEDGQQYVVLTPSPAATISQVFTVTNEGDYILSWFGSAPNYSDGDSSSPYSVTIANAMAQVVATTNFDDYHDTPVWVAHSTQMLLIPGQYTLAFQCEGQRGYQNTLIDNVSLQLTGLRITTQPQSQIGYWGQSVSFSVAATGGTPPYTYQWQQDSTSLFAATNALLVLTNLQFTNAGTYTAIVFDSASNTVTSDPANLVINPANVEIALYPGLQIGGIVGQTYGIQYSTNLANTNSWIGLTNLTLTQPTEIWYDSVPASLAQRFYRVQLGSVPIP